MCSSGNTLTILDFKIAVTKLQKYAQELFAGTDEKKKFHVLKVMQDLIDSSVTTSGANYLNRSVSKLPNEIWMKIMGYLKNKDIFRSFALVNKHFHCLTMDTSAVKYLHLKDVENKAESEALYIKWIEVIKHSKKLIELKIKDRYRHLDWNDLIEETLKTNQSLKSLKIDFCEYDIKTSTLSPGVTEALKLAKCLQNFESHYVGLSKDFFNEICQMKSLKRFDVQCPGWTGDFTTKFVENLALSKNPIEEFNTNVFRFAPKELISNAINTFYTEKKNTIKTWYSLDLRKFREEDHERCYQLPKISVCKNITFVLGILHEHDLGLIADLPKLETLSIYNAIPDVNYVKAFHRINFSKLKYLFLNVDTKDEYERIFEELSSIPFPSLKRLIVENHYIKGDMKETGVSVTEKTLEKLAQNSPKLKHLILQGSIDFASEITHEFIFNMMTNEDLVIIVESLFDDDRREVFEKKMKEFLERKGSIFYNNYQSMRRELWKQWWMKHSTKHPE